MSGLRIEVHGLGDPEADLIVAGICEQCSAVLWRRRYSRAECMAMSQTELEAMTKANAKRDHDALERHRCRAN